MCCSKCKYNTADIHTLSSLLQLRNKEVLLNQELLEKERLRKEYNDRIAAEKEKNSFITLKKLKKQEAELKVRLYRMRHLITKMN
jgi:hypothetical protein